MQAPRRVIGVAGLTFSAINMIIAAGIFGLASIAASGGLGAAALLTYVICAVLVGLVGLCLAEAGSRIGSAGGLYAYARAPFGPVIGGVAGTILWFANGAAGGAAVANLLVDTLATVAPSLGAGLPRALLIVGLYTILAVVNVRGVRYGVSLSTVLAIVKMAPLLLLVLAGAFLVRAMNLQWTTTPTAGALGQSAVAVFFAFTGIEVALCTSGEVRDPSRTVPRAIMMSLGVVTLLYLAVQGVAQGILGSELPRTDAPMISVATAIWGASGALFVVAAVSLSTIGAMAADVLCSPRVLYALALNGQLPRILSVVNERHATPAYAIGAYAFLCAVLAITGSFRQLVILSSSGTLLLYLVCSLGILRLRKLRIATAGQPFLVPGGWIVPIAATAMIIWMLSALSRKELGATAGVCILAGVAYSVQQYMMRRKAGRAVLQSNPD